MRKLVLILVGALFLASGLAACGEAEVKRVGRIPIKYVEPAAAKGKIRLTYEVDEPLFRRGIFEVDVRVKNISNEPIGDFYVTMLGLDKKGKVVIDPEWGGIADFEWIFNYGKGLKILGLAPGERQFVDLYGGIYYSELERLEVHHFEITVEGPPFGGRYFYIGPEEYDRSKGAEKPRETEEPKEPEQSKAAKESTPPMTKPGSPEETVINFLTLCYQGRFPEAEKYLGRVYLLMPGNNSWEEKKAYFQDNFEDFPLERLEITEKESRRGFGFLFYYEDGSKDKFLLPGDEWLETVRNSLGSLDDEEIGEEVQKKITSKYPILENLRLWKIEEKDPELWLEIVTNVMDEYKKRGIDVKRMTEEYMLQTTRQCGVRKVEIIKDNWFEVGGIIHEKNTTNTSSFACFLAKVNNDWLIFLWW